jgi:hypothetical protein
VIDDSQLDRAVTDGISCMGCHNQGIRQATDDIREHVLNDRTFSKFPGPAAPFQFRLKDPGTETVIAICNATGKSADGIKHDFKSRQFTDLGNHRGFLTRQIVAEAKDKLAEGQKEKAESGKETAGAPAPSEIVSRTAIKLQVK